jgi:hypothetical protein
LNIDVVEAAADDDNCAKLDRDDADELIDIFGDCRYDTVSPHLLRDMRKANDLTQLEASNFGSGGRYHKHYQFRSE